MLVHAALLEGDCVGLFPEAMTTEGDQLLRFHSSLFEPAVANHAHVHPAAIRYEHPDGSLWPALETEGLARREVAAAAQERLATLLGLRPGDRAPRTPPGPPAAPP